MRNTEEVYESLVEAIHLAVDSEQEEPGAPYKKETELRLDTVYTLLREALGITSSS